MTTTTENTGLFREQAGTGFGQVDSKLLYLADTPCLCGAAVADLLTVLPESAIISIPDK